MFADDTKLYRSVSQASDVHLLQADLNALIGWSERWQLPFNCEKCKALHLGRRNENHVHDMGGTQLTQALVEKDLGIQVDSQLKFREQAAAAISKASRILSVICRSFGLLDETTLVPTAAVSDNGSPSSSRAAFVIPDIAARWPGPAAALAARVQFCPRQQRRTEHGLPRCDRPRLSDHLLHRTRQR